MFFFSFFFLLQFHEAWLKTLQSGLQRRHRRREDRSIMSGALPGVPLKALLFSATSNPANPPSPLHLLITSTC